jgi:U6 snRNA-associated Sm-like protein LSm6
MSGTEATVDDATTLPTPATMTEVNDEQQQQEQPSSEPSTIETTNTKQMNKKTPSDFLKSIIGRPVRIKLNSGSIEYRGILGSLDGYLNIAIEQTEEYNANGQLQAKYGDCFIRGNNGTVHICNVVFFSLYNFSHQSLFFFVPIPLVRLQQHNTKNKNKNSHVYFETTTTTTTIKEYINKSIK